MSVHARKRKIAYGEFEHNMRRFCKQLYERLNSVPARYQRYINPKLYNSANRAYTALIYANEQNGNTEKGRARREMFFNEALKCLKELQKPLYAAFNVLDATEGGMQVFIDLLNREVALIYGITRKEYSPMFYALPRRKFQTILFLQKMSELHKYTYEKIGHAPKYCRDTLCAQIVDMADTALYWVVDANHTIPQTKADAEKRDEKLKNAIDSLNAMQRPMLALWNLMDYSERIMDEWAGLLDEELRLLEGLRKADKARYKSLK